MKGQRLNKVTDKKMVNRAATAKRPGYVYIIESPAACDFMNGVSEGKVLEEALDLIRVRHVYRVAVNRACFEQAISDDLEACLRRSEINPIVHVSAHGIQDEDSPGAGKNWFSCPGFALTDGGAVDWADLRRYLADINRFTGGNLIVCMSSCYGFGGTLMGFTRSRRLPYFALIGNEAKYSWSESGIGFATFYHQFFAKGARLEDAVKKMRTASGNRNFKLIHAQDARAFWLDINRRGRASTSAPVERGSEGS